jgi:hypothetical protein
MELEHLQDIHVLSTQVLRPVHLGGIVGDTSGYNGWYKDSGTGVHRNPLGSIRGFHGRWEEAGANDRSVEFWYVGGCLGKAA